MGKGRENRFKIGALGVLASGLPLPRLLAVLHTAQVAGMEIKPGQEINFKASSIPPEIIAAHCSPERIARYGQLIDGLSRRGKISKHETTELIITAFWELRHLGVEITVREFVEMAHDRVMETKPPVDTKQFLFHLVKVCARREKKYG